MNIEARIIPSLYFCSSILFKKYPNHFCTQQRSNWEQTKIITSNKTKKKKLNQTPNRNTESNQKRIKEKERKERTSIVNWTTIGIRLKRIFNVLGLLFSLSLYLSHLLFLSSLFFVSALCMYRENFSSEPEKVDTITSPWEGFMYFSVRALISQAKFMYSVYSRGKKTTLSDDSR